MSSSLHRAAVGCATAAIAFGISAQAAFAEVGLDVNNNAPTITANAAGTFFDGSVALTTVHCTATAQQALAVTVVIEDCSTTNGLNTARTLPGRVAEASTAGFTLQGAFDVCVTAYTIDVNSRRSRTASRCAPSVGPLGATAAL